MQRGVLSSANKQPLLHDHVLKTQVYGQLLHSLKVPGTQQGAKDIGVNENQCYLVSRTFQK